jgi:hypothetical protein
MGNAIDVSNYRRRRKSNLMRVLGNKCCLCGFDVIQDALEFHHIKPEEKEYGIAANGTCHDLEKDLAEIKKCVLVCANCHRLIHKGFYTEEELYSKQIYDEEIANELRQEKQQLSEKTIYYCKNCGKQLSEKTISGLCINCYNISQRITERPSREELKQLIREKPFTQIAIQYGVSDNAIRKWCDAENLPRKKSDINAYSNEEWELI